MSIKNKKVAVAMSGGVDSGTAAFLLQKEGYDVVGFFMRLGNDGDEAESAARRIATYLGIKFYPINLAPDFRKNVVEYFIDSYRNGFTPNPCVRCNRTIKFGKLFEISNKLGADFLATGHYVQVKKIQKQKNIPSTLLKSGKIIYKLYRGKDLTKDQSYFLYNLNQNILKQVLFPLGDAIKVDVKKRAKKNNLPNLQLESQDICFLSGDHNDYLREHISLKPGIIKDIDGKELGRHKGLSLYTKGQRKGIEIGGTGPYYAVRCDYENNILYVTNNRDADELYSTELASCYTNFICDVKFPLKCKASIRYGQKEVECIVEKLSSNKKNGAYEKFLEKYNKGRVNEKYFVKFKKPQRAVTNGQSVVFYKGKEVLGGGVICYQN